jgi:MarR family transcriptional regulator, 2-MHQ and catechol-resistance regulon repressor
MGTRYRGEAREVRALDALIKLVRCVASLEARLERDIRDAGLSPNQFGVLEALLHLGPLEPCELGPKLLVSRPNVVLLVDQLQERGLVRRSPVEGDRRRIRIELTPPGRRLIGRLFPHHARRVAEEMAALSAEEQDQLAHLCKRLGLRDAPAAGARSA